MGYSIKNIEELELLDFSNLDQKKETVRKSNDGLLFIISGESIIEYSKEDMITICNGENWVSNIKK